MVIVSAIAAEVFRPLHNNELKPVDTRIFSKKQILWRGRYKLLGYGSEVVVGFRAIDSVEADLVLGAVVLSEHCYCVAVCDAYDFAGDCVLGMGVGKGGERENGDERKNQRAFKILCQLTES